jgi:hypothetical protein
VKECNQKISEAEQKCDDKIQEMAKKNAEKLLKKEAECK